VTDPAHAMKVLEVEPDTERILQPLEVHLEMPHVRFGVAVRLYTSAPKLSHEPSPSRWAYPDRAGGTAIEKIVGFFCRSQSRPGPATGPPTLY